MLRLPKSILDLAKALRLPRNLHLTFRKCCACHAIQTLGKLDLAKVPRLPQNLHLTLPKCCACHAIQPLRNLRVAVPMGPRSEHGPRLPEPAPSPLRTRSERTSAKRREQASFQLSRDSLLPPHARAYFLACLFLLFICLSESWLSISCRNTEVPSKLPLIMYLHWHVHQQWRVQRRPFANAFGWFLLTLLPASVCGISLLIAGTAWHVHSLQSVPHLASCSCHSDPPISLVSGASRTSCRGLNKHIRLQAEPPNRPHLCTGGGPCIMLCSKDSLGLRRGLLSRQNRLKRGTTGRLMSILEKTNLRRMNQAFLHTRLWEESKCTAWGCPCLGTCQTEVDLLGLTCN